MSFAVFLTDDAADDLIEIVSKVISPACQSFHDSAVSGKSQ